jgi:hypothetical protein
MDGKAGLATDRVKMDTKMSEIKNTRQNVNGQRKEERGKKEKKRRCRKGK